MTRRKRALAHRSALSSSISLIGALLASASLVGCGDSASENFGESGVGGGGSEDSSGTNGAMATGSGAGAPAPPPIAPPEEELEDPSCQELDPTSPLVLYLSADDSNSMASPAEAREAIRSGWGAPSSVRTFEFLNYYDVSFPAPAYPDLGLFAEAEAGDEEGTFDLLLAVRAHDATSPRRPITMTLVLDTSGSMDGTPMDRQRAAIRALAGQLDQGDLVNVLTWAGEDRIALEGHVVDGPDDPTLLDLAEGLVSNGGTDLDGGLTAGYELAARYFGDDRLNRVVLISDGGANLGETQGDLIGLHSEDADQEGIYLVGVGTGPLGSYSDTLMDIVTDMGRGAYVYLDSEDEAEAILGERFDEVMEVAARAVRVEVTLPWYFQMKAFYGEEYSEDPEEVEPQHLAPGDATLILQTLKACSPDVVDLDDEVKLVATWETPLQRQPREVSLTTTLGALLEGDRSHLQEAEAIVAFAEALKTGDPATLSAALEKVDALADRQDPDLQEIGELLRDMLQ